MKIKLTDSDIVSMVTDTLLREGVLTSLLFGDLASNPDITQGSDDVQDETPQTDFKVPPVDSQNLSTTAQVQNPVKLASPPNGKYVTLNGNELVFAGKGLQFASSFALNGAYIAQSDRRYYNFNKSNHKCSTGAFEILGALLGKNFDIRNLSMSARNAWSFLQTWGTHTPLNQDANGTNNVNAVTVSWLGTDKKYTPMVGDVAVWHHNPGHMAVYLGPQIGGQGWVSDFRQSRMGVYKGSNKDSSVSIYRLKSNA